MIYLRAWDYKDQTMTEPLDFVEIDSMGGLFRENKAIMQSVPGLFLDDQCVYEFDILKVGDETVIALLDETSFSFVKIEETHSLLFYYNLKRIIENNTVTKIGNVFQNTDLLPFDFDFRRLRIEKRWLKKH